MNEGNPMRLGIDFGTSHIVVERETSQQSELVRFTPKKRGPSYDYFPSLVAIRGQECRYGFQAAELLEDPEWVVIRSIKSLMRQMRPDSTLTVRGGSYLIRELLTGLFRELHDQLTFHSSLKANQGEFVVSLAAPALADNSQKYHTSKLFELAGFKVENLFSEPSAAAMLYAASHFKNPKRSKREYVMVYDMGGGTFDVSLALLKDEFFHVLASSGLQRLGGDQYDEKIAGLIKARVGLDYPLDYAVETRLLECCRMAKESVTPQSKYLHLEFAFEGVRQTKHKIPLEEVYDATMELTEKSLDLTRSLIRQCGLEGQEELISAIYLVGGMVHYPQIPQRLSQAFSQNLVKRSPEGTQAVALGLGVLNRRAERVKTKNKLGQYFGLWREAEDGQRLIFEPIFSKDEPLPGKGEEPREIHRRYHPKHNIAFFSFDECSSLEEDRPRGLVRHAERIYLPLEKKMEGQDLQKAPIVRYERDLEHEVEEIYQLDHTGEVSFRFINHQTGYTQVYHLKPKD